jgi:osmotically inducible protein OsmC
MNMISTATAHWEGNLVSGAGTASLGSEATKPLPVSWKARTEDHAGLTSPEELMAAAHASCFSMSLASRLAKAGTPPTSVDTQAVADFEKLEGGWQLTTMTLTTRVIAPGSTSEAFAALAEDAKHNCPVSKALKGNVKITLDAALVD